MKFCPECGAKLVSQKFCAECGADLRKYFEDTNNGSSLGNFDFSTLEQEAQKQLAEQERLNDFEIENGMLKKYVGQGGKVVVPKSVTVIGPKAFSHDWSIRDKITEVVFEGNITEIGEEAFRGCHNMQCINLPGTVRKIGKSAFSGTAITSISLPSRLEWLGDGAFSCSGLTTVTIPGGVSFDESTWSDRGIFASCASLRSVIVENGVTNIQRNMFSGCGALESITVPASVKSMGDSAFADCVSLRSIVVPYGVTKITSHLFSNCRSLTRVDLPGSITSIEYSAFSGCRSLASITIPQNVTSIQDEAFFDCVALESIQYNAASAEALSEATRGFFTYCQNSVFQNAGSERSGIRVTFGSGVTCIPDGLFYSENCKIASIAFEAGCICEKIGAFAFYKCAMVRSIQIPSRVVEIGDYAFFSCSSIARLNLPSGLKKIGQGAFSACENLVNITMPSYLTEIEKHTFNGCKSLESITIPNGVRKLGEAALMGCDSITSLVIPESIKEIEHYAFKIKNRMTIKLPRALSWHFFKEEYEFDRDNWKLIEY